MIMSAKRFLVMVAISAIGFGPLKSASVIPLSECEKSFLKNNLQLLSSQFNIDAQKALEIQAKIWQTPYLSGEINLYNPNNSQFFDVGNKGQKAISVAQLIYLGGKKKKEIDLAKTNTQIAEFQFQQLLLNLKRQLHVNYISLYYDLKNLNRLNDLIQKLDTLNFEYSQQAKKGNIALKEMVRLQSLTLNIKNDKIELEKSILDEKHALKLLCGTTIDIEPTFDNRFISQIKTVNPKLTLDSAWIVLKSKNPELLTSNAIITAGKQFVSLQKSLSIPDLTVGVAYDQRGGAFNNQLNITFGMPLPLWNVNKGNILSAEITSKIAETDANYLELDLKNRLDYSFYLWDLLHNQSNQYNDELAQQFDLVEDGIWKNFRKQNISLIEFTDFMESFNTNNRLMNETFKQLMIGCFEINFLTNSNVFF